MAQINRSPIRFVLQRPGLGPAHDEVIEISKMNMRCYEIVDYDKESDYQTRVVLDEYSTLRYVQTMMDMLSADDDPFDYFQVDVPGYPSIQLKVERLSSPQIRSNIFGMLKSCMRHWPETTRPAMPRRHAAPAVRPPGVPA